MENCNNTNTELSDDTQSQPSIFEQVVPREAIKKPREEMTSEISLEHDIFRKPNDTSLKAYEQPSPGIKGGEQKQHPIFGETSDGLSFGSNFESLTFDKDQNLKNGFKNPNLLNIKFKTYSLNRENGIEIQSAGLKPQVESLGKKKPKPNVFQKNIEEIQSAKLKPKNKFRAFENDHHQQKVVGGVEDGEDDKECKLHLARKFSDIVEEKGDTSMDEENSQRDEFM